MEPANPDAETVDVSTCCECASGYAPRNGDIATGCAQLTCAVNDLAGNPYDCGDGAVLSRGRPLANSYVYSRQTLSNTLSKTVSQALRNSQLSKQEPVTSLCLRC